MCDTAIGVDDAIKMINKAKRLDTEGQYILSDLMDYKPKKSGFGTQHGSLLLLFKPIKTCKSY